MRAITTVQAPWLALAPHAYAPPIAVDSVVAGCRFVSASTLEFRYRIHGDLARLQLPTARGGERRDGLWEHTCCEAFIATGDASYLELNFAPNADWASYRFTGYRRRAADPVVATPQVRTHRDHGRFELEALVEARGWLPDEPGSALRVALAAIIEERDDTRSYWALCHRTDRPDFHDMNGFTLQVARGLNDV